MAYPYGSWQPTAPQLRPRPRRRGIGLWITGVTAVVVIALVVVIVALVSRRGPDASEEPFDGLAIPTQVALDDAGNIYVRDKSDDHVLRFTPERVDRTELSFGDDVNIFDMAVSRSGDVYVIDRAQRVLVLRAGEDEPTEVESPSSATPFAPDAIAMDSSGVLWVVDAAQGELLTLTGSTWTSVGSIPPGVSASSLVVADDGSVYVLLRDNTSGVTAPFQLRGESWEPLPASRIETIGGLAVDHAGVVYLTDSTTGALYGLSPGRTTWRELYGGEVERPAGLAIGDDGSLYVADTSYSSVEVVPPH